MKFWKLLVWVLRALVFAVLLLFALKNTDPVALRFYLDASWQAPLILVLLAFFALGAAAGVLACLGKLLAQRREILELKRQNSQPPLPAEPVVPTDLGA